MIVNEIEQKMETGMSLDGESVMEYKEDIKLLFGTGKSELQTRLQNAKEYIGIVTAYYGIDEIINIVNQHKNDNIRIDIVIPYNERTGETNASISNLLNKLHEAGYIQFKCNETFIPNDIETLRNEVEKIGRFNRERISAIVTPIISMVVIWLMQQGVLLLDYLTLPESFVLLAIVSVFILACGLFYYLAYVLLIYFAFFVIRGIFNLLFHFNVTEKDQSKIKLKKEFVVNVYKVNILFISDKYINNKSNTLHAKIYNVDNSYLYIGSMNLTHTGLNYNLESGVEIFDKNVVSDFWKNQVAESINKKINERTDLKLVNVVQKQFATQLQPIEEFATYGKIKKYLENSSIY